MSLSINISRLLISTLTLLTTQCGVFFGHLGIILEDYGFRVTASGKTSTFFEFWFERPVITEAAIPSYPHLLTWTENMQYFIQQYDTYYRPALKCFKELKELTDEKKKNKR